MVDFLFCLPIKCYLGILELLKAGEIAFYFIIGYISVRVITLLNSVKQVLLASLSKEKFSTIADIGKL